MKRSAADSDYHLNLDLNPTHLDQFSRCQDHPCPHAEVEVDEDVAEVDGEVDHRIHDLYAEVRKSRSSQDRWALKADEEVGEADAVDNEVDQDSNLSSSDQVRVQGYQLKFSSHRAGGSRTVRATFGFRFVDPRRQDAPLSLWHTSPDYCRRISY